MKIYTKFVEAGAVPTEASSSCCFPTIISPAISSYARLLVLNIFMNINVHAKTVTATDQIIEEIFTGFTPRSQVVTHFDR